MLSDGTSNQTWFFCQDALQAELYWNLEAIQLSELVSFEPRTKVLSSNWTFLTAYKSGIEASLGLFFVFLVFLRLIRLHEWLIFHAVFLLHKTVSFLYKQEYRKEKIKVGIGIFIICIWTSL